MDLVPLYRRPAFRTAMGSFLWLVAFSLVFRLAAPRQPGLALLLDLILFSVSLVLVLLLVSQFVLPARSWAERQAVFGRLLDYALGNRGPVLFLRKGEAVEAKDERSRQGAGVLLADYTSAGVLRTETRYTRAVGPGLTFTEAGERLAAALDLRRQVRAIRGRTPPPSGAIPEGSTDSLALTEDGIPVAADLRVTFMLDPGHSSTPRQGQFPNLPPYEFNPRAAERAVYGHAHRADRATTWTDLPLLMAVDLWREQVKRWQLDSLLASGGSHPTPLERIEAAIQANLVPADPDQRQPERGTAPREMEVLRRRGIRVLSVEVGNLKVPEQVRQEHLRRWRERWTGSAEEEVLEARSRGQQARWTGERDGQAAMLRGVTADLRSQLAEGRQPRRRDSLISLLEGAIHLLGEPEWLPESGALIGHLRRVAADVRRMDPDCRQQQG